MSDENSRIYRLESRVRQAEDGLAALGAAANQLAQVQARDGEALANLRATAAPDKIQGITNDLASIKQRLSEPTASQRALDGLSAKIRADSAVADTHARHISALQSSAKIVYAVLAALGLAVLGALGSLLASHLGGHP